MLSSRFGLAVFIVKGLFAQAPHSPSQLPSSGRHFEVATVKPTDPESTKMRRSGGPGTSDPTTLTFTKVPLALLLQTAYEMEAGQISGPSWLADERYDIVARVPLGATKTDADLMLRNLLLERFHMSVRQETRDVPGWVLTIAKGGIKFKESVPSPTEPKRAGCRLGPDKDGFPRLAPGCEGQLQSGSPGSRVSYIVGQSTALSSLMPELSVFLKVGKERILDKTGLLGKYDYRLKFSGAALNVDAGTGEDPSLPDLVPALQKQLGLNLEEKSVAVETVVIVHAEKVPSDN